MQLFKSIGRLVRGAFGRAPVSGGPPAAPARPQAKKHRAKETQPSSSAAGMPVAPARSQATKSDKTAHAAPPLVPERDVWFSDAVVWSLNGRWLSAQAWSPPPGSKGAKRLEEFREKAASGKLTIWGIADTTGKWEAIGADYWRSCGFEPISFLEGRDHVFTEAKQDLKAKAKPKRGAQPPTYSSLMVNKRQVEALWRDARNPKAA